MSTHLPGFQSFFSFFASFLLASLSTSSIMVKLWEGLDAMVVVLGHTLLHSKYQVINHRNLVLTFIKVVDSI